MRSDALGVGTGVEVGEGLGVGEGGGRGGGIDGTDVGRGGAGVGAGFSAGGRVQPVIRSITIRMVSVSLLAMSLPSLGLRGPPVADEHFTLLPPFLQLAPILHNIVVCDALHHLAFCVTLARS